MRAALTAKKGGRFDPNIFLATIGEGRKICPFRRNKSYLRKETERMPFFMSRKAK
jgi:hypothetical protein